MNLVNEAVKFAVENPEVIAFAVPAALQGLSVLVKKSPWGWDDSLLDWAKKNKAGLSLVGKLITKRKR